MADLQRVVVLIDMDCFYCQVEEQLNPALKGKPIAVVQYNPWRGGGIIAVNYPAREKGVSRHMRGDDAKKSCPDINLVRVPQVRGKADLSKYRDAGKTVADVLQTFTSLLERASIDEAYMDITESVDKRMNDFINGIQPELVSNTFFVGYNSIKEFLKTISENMCSIYNLKLAVGAVIVEELRAEVFKQTGYKCSAGIAHNKVLAKLVCSLHKPNKQTVLVHESIPDFYEKLPIKKIKSLGGKFGNTVSEELGITYMGELKKFSERDLMKKFDEKTGAWLYNIARGIDTEPVTTRLISKSIGCCKKFPGKNMLTNQKNIDHWLNELASEITERLDKDLKENNRKAKQMVISFSQIVDNKIVSSSRTHPLTSYEQPKIFKNASDVIKRFCMKADKSYTVTYLGISIGNFEEMKKVRQITSFFKEAESKSKIEECKKANGNKQNISSYFKTTITKQSKTNILGKNNDKESSCEYFNDMEIEISNPGIEEIKLDKSRPVDYIEENCKSKKRSSISPCLFEDVEESDESRWSFSTEDLEQDPKDYVFYDEMCNTLNENVYDSTRLNFERNEELNQQEELNNVQAETAVQTSLDAHDLLHNSEDSITDEILSGVDNSVNNDDTREKHSPTYSFFRNYFANRETSVHSETPIRRDFDTSKVFDDDDSNTSSKAEETTSDNDIVETNINECFQSNDVEPTVCSVCNKLIKNEELTSHMDYHFALELVRQESTTYEAQSILENKAELKQNKPNTKGKKNNKRKSDDKITSIEVFLCKDNNVTDKHKEENTEVCNECKKEIKLEDMASHMDYHMAKKLHREINFTTVNKGKSNEKSEKKMKVNHKNVTNSTRSLVSYFQNL